eukprot:4281441-Prymnesium_polylepis.1
MLATLLFLRRRTPAGQRRTPRQLAWERNADTRRCEFISLLGTRARQSGRVHPTGRPGGPLNGGTTPQCN